jgi:hypothetical protein
MIVQAAISKGGQRKRIRQLLRGAQQASQPGMVRYHSSTGGSTEVKESMGVRLPRRGPKAFRVAEMSEVTRTCKVSFANVVSMKHPFETSSDGCMTSKLLLGHDL